MKFDPKIYGKEALYERRSQREVGLLNRPLRPAGGRDGILRLAHKLIAQREEQDGDGRRTTQPRTPET